MMPPLSRDRLLAFAFAPAELLAVVAPDHSIAWAAGAYPARFGRAAEAMLGRPIAELLAPEYHETLDAVLRATARIGRAAPIEVRLADPARSRFALSALSLPGGEPALCLSLGPLPQRSPPPAPGAEADPGFRHALEARVRDSARGTLNLLQLPESAPNPAAALQTLPGAHAVSRLAPGRFGVLTDGGPVLPALVAAVETLVVAAGGEPGQVRGDSIALDRAGLSAGQAVRAIRLALQRFTGDGIAPGGFGAGLAGLVAATGAEAEAVRRTISGGHFRLALQPVVALSDRGLHHYEALLRPDPTIAGPRGTQEFVTIAEAVGLAETLDLAVLRAVLARLTERPDAPVAANISGLSLQSPVFRETLLALLRPHGGGALLIEFTETAEIDNLAEAAETLRQLRAAGVPVCLDDFGAGGAAFRYLRELRADFVKLDGGFVQRAVAGGRDRAILGSMIEAAHAAGAALIAEMIETEAQCDLMRALGVGYGQGWLFGHPLGW